MLYLLSVGVEQQDVITQTVYRVRGMGYGLCYLVDSSGCVLLFEGDWFETRLCLLRPDSAVKARDLMRDKGTRFTPFVVRCRIVFNQSFSINQSIKFI